MCGRFTQRFTWRELVALYDIHEDATAPNFAARYNLAPSQQAVTIRRDDSGRREAAMLRWGLIPSWAKDAKIGYSTFNARAEGIAEKPAFRTAYRNRRCLVPASGYYEWTGPKSTRQPFYFSAVDGRPLTFAGLWDRWTDTASGERIDSFTIVTTAANEFAARWHDRMPAILGPDALEGWLNGGDGAALLNPAREGLLQAWAVSPAVNSTRADSPVMIEPTMAN